MTHPRVSICIPTYNSSRYVAEAIESVLEQSYTDLEVIISDNCSSDSTPEIVAEFAKGDDRVRWSTNEKNLGMVGNFNTCMQRASGEYIKFILSDDRFASRDALHRMVDVMDRHRSVVLTSSARSVIDESSKVIQIMARYGGRDFILPGNIAVRDGLIDLRNLIGEPSTVLFRRDRAARGFDQRYRQFVDLEMWFHLLLKGDFAYLHEPLCSFRVHQQQQTADNLRENREIGEQVLLWREYGSQPDLRITALERAFMRFLPAWNVWKLYRREKRITRDQAVRWIREIYPPRIIGFFLFFPVYRVLKMLLSLNRRIMLHRHQRPLAIG